MNKFEGKNNMKTIKALGLFAAAALFTACGTAERLPTGTDDTATKAAVSESVTQGEKTEEGEKEVKPIEYKIDPTKPVIALTFDDGPNTTTTVQVLDLLEKYQVKASFFLIGDNINDESAKSVKRAYDLGCEINNHSKTHSYMNKLTEEAIREEVAFVADKVKEITGETTRFFRPPYIAVNDAMYDNIDMPFICGVGCDDWDDSVSVETRLKRLDRSVGDGAIILLHDARGNDKTVEMLDTLIPQLLEEGYQFATVSELFEAKGVAISGDDKNLYSKVGDR